MSTPRPDFDFRTDTRAHCARLIPRPLSDDLGHSITSGHGRRNEKLLPPARC